jgi:hypothetical protein
MPWTSCVRRSRRPVDRVLKLCDQIRSPHRLDQHHVGTCANRQPTGLARALASRSGAARAWSSLLREPQRIC